MAYDIEQVLCSKNGYFTPAEAKNYYGRYDRHGITWHWWGDGTGASNHNNIVNYMVRGSIAGEKSVNYVLSDGKITLCVGPDNVAWASQSGNATTISVELQPTLGGEGYKKAGWLASELAGRYGGDRKYYPHNYWYSTQCPGTISLDRIRQEEDKWQRGEYSGSPTPAPTPIPVYNFVSQIGKAVIKDTGNEGLWVLKSPSLTGQTVTVVPEGTVMDFVGYVTNGDNVEGNTKWWKNAFGNYFSARYAPEYVAPAPTPTPAPTPAPAPAEPVVLPVTLVTMYTLNNAKLVNIKDMSVVKVFPIDTPMEIAGESSWNGNKFWLTKSSVDGKRLTGFLVGDLKPEKEPPIVPPVIITPDWVTNLRDIDDTQFWFKEDCDLWDIVNNKPAEGNFAKHFKKDEAITMSALTSARGVEFRLTQYSHDKKFYNGIQTDKLTLTPPGVPDIPPIPVEPPKPVPPVTNVTDSQKLDQILELVKKLCAHLGINS